MAATVTVTGSTGPGHTLTAVVYTDVLWFRVDTNKNLLTFQKNGLNSPTFVEITSVDTVTATKAGTGWTLTLAVA